MTSEMDRQIVLVLVTEREYLLLVLLLELFEYGSSPLSKLTMNT